MVPGLAEATNGFKPAERLLNLLPLDPADSGRFACDLGNIPILILHTAQRTRPVLGEYRMSG
jgi:hypothetical protein